MKYKRPNAFPWKPILIGVVIILSLLVGTLYFTFRDFEMLDVVWWNVLNAL